jgi:hypothetical protein
MNLKQFLKPDWRKIVVFIVLLIIFLVIYKYKLSLMAGELPSSFPAKGLPLPIYIGCPEKMECPEKTEGSEKLLKLFLIINLIFWYFTSCFIIWIYDKVKKKV